MHDLTPRSEIRTLIEANGEYGYTVAAAGSTILYRSPVHLDEASARGYLIDLRAALNNAQCLWCGDPATLISEIDGLDIFAFSTEQCYTEALQGADEENR